MRQREARQQQELEFLRARAERASEEHDRAYRRRNDAAAIICRSFRRNLVRSRLRRRCRLQQLCRGASTHARTVKASRPPAWHPPPPARVETAPSNNPVSSHPFRERGQQLPKRKRRQRHRRPRRRPPRALRRASLQPSPPTHRPSQPTAVGPNIHDSRAWGCTSTSTAAPDPHHHVVPPTASQRHSTCATLARRIHNAQLISAAVTIQLWLRRHRFSQLFKQWVAFYQLERFERNRLRFETEREERRLYFEGTHWSADQRWVRWRG